MDALSLIDLHIGYFFPSSYGLKRGSTYLI